MYVKTFMERYIKRYNKQTISTEMCTAKITIRFLSIRMKPNRIRVYFHFRTEI